VTGDIRFKHEALDLFDAIGTTLWVDSEKELDIATAVAGSGPAYLALVAEALMDGAVNQGLKRTDATALVRGLFAGFSPLIYNDHPAIVKDKVMSPAGTTAAGYAKLEEHGVRIGVINAIQAAFERTKK
jgi:pyrroline-5-carboxylate reductase